MNLECVYKVYRGLGRTDIVVRFVFLEFCSAVGARVGVESRVDISEAYFGFQVPMLVQNPGIPVYRAHAQEPSLVTPVGEFGEVASQKREVVFQPAEEWGHGMNAMIADGLGTDIGFDEIYGLHTMPGLPVGSFAIRPGPFMGAEDGFEIKVTGAGGHASRPHECRDAILCASSIVTELQTIVSRIIDPSELAVVSVTGISGSNIKNAIASEAVIEGDCRHFSADVSEKIETSIRRIAKGMADAHRCDLDVSYERVFVPLVNDEMATEAAVAAAREVFGNDKVNPDAAKMGAAADFARILEYALGAFGNIGNGDSATLHSPNYDFNDDALKNGVNWYAALIRARLPLK